MAVVQQRTDYEFILKSDEFTLLSRALTGQMTQAEAVQAAALNLRIHEERAKRIGLANDACQRALNYAKENARRLGIQVET